MPNALARQIFKDVAEHHKLKNSEKEITSIILERAEYLHENWHWLFGEDRDALVEIAQKIGELSETVLERDKGREA